MDPETSVGDLEVDCENPGRLTANSRSNDTNEHGNACHRASPLIAFAEWVRNIGPPCCFGLHLSRNQRQGKDEDIIVTRQADVTHRFGAVKIEGVCVSIERAAVFGAIGAYAVRKSEGHGLAVEISGHRPVAQALSE